MYPLPFFLRIIDWSDAMDVVSSGFVRTVACPSLPTPTQMNSGNHDTLMPASVALADDVCASQYVESDAVLYGFTVSVDVLDVSCPFGLVAE